MGETESETKDHKTKQKTAQVKKQGEKGTLGRNRKREIIAAWDIFVRSLYIFTINE